MKVHELFEESKPDYFNRLEKDLKIKRIGTGAFARVFQHPTDPNIAVKVFTDEDHAFRHYLKFCQAHPDNKYLPKIFSVVKHRHNPEKKDKDLTIDEIVDWKYSIAFMEKLKPVSKDYLVKFISKFGIYDKEFADLTDSEWRILAYRQDEDPDLAEFAKYLLKTNYVPDLHTKNVMLRGKQIVFIDPIS